jgi:RES domain-containing protein
MRLVRVHDRDLLDRLEALAATAFAGDVWRVVRQGRACLRGSNADGRWGAAGEFEVLYTACDRDGALAEIGYRLGLEPVWPSKIAHTIHRIGVRLDRILDLTDFALLARLGIDAAGYAGHDYASTQAVSAAAHFLGYQAIRVPNARYRGNNLVVFADAEGALSGLHDQHAEAVDWQLWRAVNPERPRRRD